MHASLPSRGSQPGRRAGGPRSRNGPRPGAGQLPSRCAAGPTRHHESMEEVSVRPIDLERLAAILPADRAERLEAAAERARSAFGDRVVWHVNATAHGGGVAEMLQTLLAYGKGAGIENRWLVLDGDPQFFAITKRLHNVLHGEPGDGGPLGPAEHAHYEAVLRANLADLVASRLTARHRPAPRSPDRRAGRGPARAGGAGGLALPRGTRPAQRPHRGGLGVPASVPRARAGAGVLAAGVRAGVGRRRPAGRHPSVDRPVRGQEHAAAPDDVGAVLAAGRAGRGRRPGGPVDFVAARRHARHGAGPSRAQAGSCWAATHRRSTYRWWCR